MQVTLKLGYHWCWSFKDEGGLHIGISAVTGDLTVAVGFANGNSVEAQATAGTLSTKLMVM